MSELRREIGLWRGTALNMIEMVGIGPFTTIPLILMAMGGGRSMLAWVLGALLAISDGLVTAELAAQMPSSGGSYRFLRESFGAKLGRLLSFLFLFQMLISVPLSAASGCIGFANYASFYLPDISPKAIAATMAILTTLILLRRIDTIGRLSILLWIGVVTTLGIVIAVGLPHLRLEAFEFWKAPRYDQNVGYAGLGTALIFAVYDYLGYYNIANVGDEVKEPTKTVPRVIIISILAIAVLYILMNASLISVLPMQQAMHSKAVVSEYLALLLGEQAAKWLTLLILWTAFASVFSLMLGYSRAIYAAAKDGNFFPFFARVHPTGAYPINAVLLLGGLATFFCIFDLGTVVKSLITIRAVNPFITQIIGAVVLRIREPERPRPFKMWLYPLPAIVAVSLWTYVLISPQKGFKVQSLILFSVGILFYVVREIVTRRAVARNARGE
jgi:amino acid transporter